MFTLDELNQRIQSFPFGANDFRNKPSLLKNLSASDCTYISQVLYQINVRKSNVNFNNN